MGNARRQKFQITAVLLHLKKLSLILNNGLLFMCMNDTLSSNAEIYKSHFYNDTEIIEQFSNALFHWFSNIFRRKTVTS